VTSSWFFIRQLRSNIAVGKWYLPYVESIFLTNV